MRERAKSGARTKTVRGGRGEGDCQTRDLSFRHFVAYWLRSSKQNRDGLQEFWRPCPSPQYFQNYKELVRKSVFCPPPQYSVMTPQSQSCSAVPVYSRSMCSRSSGDSGCPLMYGLPWLFTNDILQFVQTKLKILKIFSKSRVVFPTFSFLV